MKTLSRLGVALAFAFPVSALADPAMVYDMGGKFDKSFNEAAYRGLAAWKKQTGKNVLEFEIANETQREQGLRRMAERGANPIIAIGFSQAGAVEKVAKDFPKIQFTVIDANVNRPNVQSVLFKEHEGSFLVGIIAATMSKTGTVGFIGGMDIPLIRKFQCGYIAGVKHANPKANVVVNMVGTTGSAWSDPARGAELAKAQFARGADIIFAAAGGTGTGIYQAAKDAGRFAIGVDSNQNYMQPGTMLTSMVKSVDVAVQDALNGHKPGLRVLGLKENAVDYARDEHNAKVLPADVRAKADAAKADIIAGKIKVPDYMANECKA